MNDTIYLWTTYKHNITLLITLLSLTFKQDLDFFQFLGGCIIFKHMVFCMKGQALIDSSAFYLFLKISDTVMSFQKQLIGVFGV